MNNLNFIQNILPEIPTKITITKIYFYDIFERYIHFLIITDTVHVLINIIILMIIYVIWKRTQNPKKRYYKKILNTTIILIIGSIITTLFIIINTKKLIKDFYIPEVRVYKELQILLK